MYVNNTYARIYQQAMILVNKYNIIFVHFQMRQLLIIFDS